MLQPKNENVVIFQKDLARKNKRRGWDSRQGVGVTGAGQFEQAKGQGDRGEMGRNTKLGEKAVN